MTTIRIMSYNLQGCRDSSALSKTIDGCQANLVALQNVTNIVACNRLANQYGYSLYSNNQVAESGTLVLLSKRPIKFFHTYDLGTGAYCMYSEHTVDDCRFNLINIEMKGGFFKRPEQIDRLLNLDLFEPTKLQLPSLVVGDFWDSIWISGHYRFQDKFIRLSPTFVRGTYPAYFPVFSRDRAYATDNIRLQNITIDRSKSARRATLHLPIVLDIEVQDNRDSISVGNELPSRMDVAPGSL